MTTRNMIEKWIERGKEKNCSHLLVVCDTFKYEDYPVFVERNEDIQAIIYKYVNINMQKVLEVYNLDDDIIIQLDERRSWNI